MVTLIRMDLNTVTSTVVRVEWLSFQMILGYIGNSKRRSPMCQYEPDKSKTRRRSHYCSKANGNGHDAVLLLNKIPSAEVT